MTRKINTMLQKKGDVSAELRIEIEKEIKHRKRYVSMDFALAHVFLWTSILSCFAASIIVASNAFPNNKRVVAIIAGIPGLVILIDKSFDFTKRAVWGTIYRIDLDELSFTRIDPFEFSKKFRRLKRRRELDFSRIGFFAKEKQDPPNKTPPSESLPS